MVFFSYNLLHDVMQLDFVFEKHNSNSSKMKKDVVSLRKRQALLTDEFFYIVYALLMMGVVPWYTIHITHSISSYRTLQLESVSSYSYQNFTGIMHSHVSTI